jgi:phosphoglycerate dehydrogenase-like enzyme
MSAAAPGDRPLVLLSYRPNHAPLQAIRDTLDMSAEIVILPDHPREGSAGERDSILRRARVLLGWFPSSELSAEDVGLFENLGLIQLMSAGADTVPLEAVPAGATLAANVGGYAEPIAEHTVAMAMALAKRLPQKHAELARGVFEQQPLNRWIAGSTCGILGFGGIGRAVGRLMTALGARIHAVNTSGRTDEPVEFCGTLADLDRVLEAADILAIALPLTPDTDGLIGAAELGRMKPGAILVNVARGAIVDQGALFEHLRTHPDFSAGIDAWWVEPFVQGEFRLDFPFFDLPNLLGSPHNSGFLPGVDVTAARRAAENVARWLRDEPISGVMRSGA